MNSILVLDINTMMALLYNKIVKSER